MVEPVLVLYFSESGSYEHHVADIYCCEDLLVLKITVLDTLPFLTPAYDVIRSDIKNLPFGLMTDKMTKHLTQHNRNLHTNLGCEIQLSSCLSAICTVFSH